MNTYLDLYFAIDRRHKGWISAIEFSKHVENNNLASSLISEWKLKFDPAETGIFDLERMCRILHLTLEEVERQYPLTGDELEDIWEIDSDMPEGLKRKVCGLIDEAIVRFNIDEYNLVQYIKLQLDQLEGPVWHVIVVRGHYYANITHLAGFGYTIRRNQRVFILYRTADP